MIDFLSSFPFPSIRISGADVLEFAVVAGAIGIWLLALVAVRASTRPRDVTPAPSTSDFGGQEPPAVVSLLVNRWTLNEDAAESTLLDLGARGWIEFRQPSNDPMHTTVHVLPGPAGAGSAGPAGAEPLLPYEQQVLDRVHQLAVDQVVPLTALTFRDRGEAQRFRSQLNDAVIEDARARGLSRRRISPQAVGLLTSAAAAPAIVAGLVAAEHARSIGPAFFAGVAVFSILSAVAGRPMGERDTPAGQVAAAKWLGLKGFLRNDEAFADLPPASVVVWDRYLSYGDALGVTRVSSALIDLGMGDRKQVWSAFGTGWHRVKIAYPRFWHRYGMTAPHIARRAGYALVAGFLILRQTSALDFTQLDIAAAVGWLIVFRAVYRLLRLAGDLAAPRTLTGELLWTENWKSKSRGEDNPSIPLVDYFAVDDTGGDKTRAWAIPSLWAQEARPGDIVTITVRPWTRRVTLLTLVSRRGQHLAGAGASSAGSPPPVPAPVPASLPAPVPASVPVPAAVPSPLPSPLPGAIPVPAVVAAAAAAATAAAQGAVAGPAGLGQTRLLSADEVSGALGRQVVSDDTTGVMRLGAFDLETFSDPQLGTPVLVLAIAHGPAQELVLRAAGDGHPVANVGDEAWAGPNWVIARKGDAVVRLHAERGTGIRPSVLTGLVGRAMSRLAG